MPAPDETRVLVVAEDTLARAGLAALASSLAGCGVAGQTAGDEELPGALELYGPDIVLWELGLDPQRALERLALLRARSALCKSLHPAWAPPIDGRGPFL